MSPNYVKAEDFTFLLQDLQLDLKSCSSTSQRTAGQARILLRSLGSTQEHWFHLFRPNVQNLRPDLFIAFKIPIPIYVLSTGNRSLGRRQLRKKGDFFQMRNHQQFRIFLTGLPAINACNPLWLHGIRIEFSICLLVFFWGYWKCRIIWKIKQP